MPRTPLAQLLGNELYEARVASTELCDALWDGVHNALDKGYDTLTILYAVWTIVDEVTAMEREIRRMGAQDHA